MRKQILNRGLHYRRVWTNERERAFAKAWENECIPRRGIDYGGGLLQDLMVLTSRQGRRRGFFQTLDCIGWAYRRVAFRIRRRDACIAATVVQWLGSTCGLCFLDQCLKSCGYRIVRDEALIAAKNAKEAGGE